MKFSDFLNEGISDIVYHFTSTTNAQHICKSDSFELTGSLGTDSEEEHAPKGKPYYFSTTRMKHARFTVNGVYNNDVIYELDGTKLRYNLSGKAMDYWDEDMRKYSKGSYEAEDRIYSSKSTINNASKYIKSIHILIKSDGDTYDNISRSNRRLLICLKKSGLKYYVYGDKRAFLSQNTNKSISVNSDMLKGKEVEQFKRFDYSEIKNKVLGSWVELYHHKNESELSEVAKKMLYEMRYHYDRNDAIINLKNELQYSRKQYRKNYNKFYDMYKKSGYDTLDDFVSGVVSKWKD